MPRISGPEWYQLLKQVEKEYEGKDVIYICGGSSVTIKQQS